MTLSSPARTVVTTTVAVVLAGCGATGSDGDGFRAVLPEVATAPAPSPSPSPVSAADAVTQRLAELREATLAAATPPAAEPAWLTIPAIGVDTPTIDLQLTAEEAEVPTSFDIAGWYRQTVEPGTVGPSVIVGHVGSKAGPGVFARLDQLRPGDEILVTDDEGTTRTFVVDAGGLVDKYERPANVFGRGEDRPELRLITCGGEFDSAIGHHVSNYVIWAHLQE